MSAPQIPQEDELACVHMLHICMLQVFCMRMALTPLPNIPKQLTQALDGLSQGHAQVGCDAISLNRLRD